MKRKRANVKRNSWLVRGNYGGGRKHGVVWRLAALCVVMVFFGAGSVDRANSTATVDSIQRAEILSAYGKLPIQFIANQGQYPKEVNYYFRSPGGTIYFTSDAVVMQFMEPVSDAIPSRHQNEQGIEQRPVPGGGEPDTESQSARGYVIRKQFVGTKPECRIEGSSALPGTVNIFRGSDPSQWKTSIPTFKELIYHNLYHGIDLVYKGVEGRLKYDLIVNPGADVSRVRFIYEGVDRIQVKESGALAMSVTSEGNSFHGMHEERKPIIYQEIAGNRIFVDGAYHLNKDGSIGFQLSGHDPLFPVVIDPATDLVYSTFLGGGDDDRGRGIAVDGSGNVYVTGYAYSSNFPVTSGAFDTTHNGASDVFVTKLNPSGSALVYSTFLGGGSDDRGEAIAIDSSGIAYITGYAYSSNFPVTPGAFDTSYNEDSDGFVTKLDASGSALLYSTFLGGDLMDVGTGIEVDGEGNAYVTGTTWSSNFPVTPGTFEPTRNLLTDSFVAKLNSDGSALIYATFLAGSSDDHVRSITVDRWGNACVTGWTQSSDFPVTPGVFQPTMSGTAVYDFFVTKLNAVGSDLIFSTYMGGGWGEPDIAVDNVGNVYVAGVAVTEQFPVTPGAFDTTHNGGDDAFVSKLNASGSTLIYSTFLGGGSDDGGGAIAIDGLGNAYVTGYTVSSDFPVTPGAFDTTNNGSGDVFATRLNADGSALLYSTFLGGGSNDWGEAVAIDSSDNAYITGATQSSNFPVTPGAFDTTYSGGGSYGDVFVSKLYMGPLAAQPALWQHYH